MPVWTFVNDVSLYEKQLSTSWKRMTKNDSESNYQRSPVLLTIKAFMSLVVILWLNSSVIKNYKPNTLRRVLCSKSRWSATSRRMLWMPASRNRYLNHFILLTLYFYSCSLNLLALKAPQLFPIFFRSNFVQMYKRDERRNFRQKRCGRPKPQPHLLMLKDLKHYSNELDSMTISRKKATISGMLYFNNKHHTYTQHTPSTGFPWIFRVRKDDVRQNS